MFSCFNNCVNTLRIPIIYMLHIYILHTYIFLHTRIEIVPILFTCSHYIVRNSITFNFGMQYLQPFRGCPSHQKCGSSEKGNSLWKIAFRKSTYNHKQTRESRKSLYAKLENRRLCRLYTKAASHAPPPTSHHSCLPLPDGRE